MDLARPAAKLAPVAAILALTVYGVVKATRSLTVDEAATLSAADDPLDQVLEQALAHDPGQVAHRALLHAALEIDRAEWWLRAPSFAAALVAAASVAWLARMLAGRRAGIAAAAVFAVGAGVAEISQLARPYALAVAAAALSSSLFVRALTTSGMASWAGYGLVSAVLPLAHPATGAVLAAHAAALVVARGSDRRRVALPVFAVVAAVAGLLLVAATIDRDAAAGKGDASLQAVLAGAGRAAGWNPLVVGLACFGVVWLVRRRRADEAPWQATLVAGLAVAPLLAVLVAGMALPVFPRYALVLCAPGLAAGAGIGLAAIEERSLAVLLAGAAAVVAVLALASTAVTPVREDWRAAARLVREQHGPRETVVVVPRRAHAALAYYAPYLRTHVQARGDGAWVLVASRSGDASELARSVVRTPRYALLQERSFGKDLLVQHWIRP